MALPTLQELLNSLNALTSRVATLETTLGAQVNLNSDQGNKISALENRVAELENRNSGVEIGEIEEEITEVKQACGIFAEGFEKLETWMGKGKLIPEGEYFR